MPSRLFLAKLSARENFFLKTPPKGTKTTYGGSGESGGSGEQEFRHFRHKRHFRHAVYWKMSIDYQVDSFMDLLSENFLRTSANVFAKSSWNLENLGNF